MLRTRRLPHVQHQTRRRNQRSSSLEYPRLQPLTCFSLKSCSKRLATLSNRGSGRRLRCSWGALLSNQINSGTFSTVSLQVGCQQKGGAMDRHCWSESFSRRLSERQKNTVQFTT